MNLSRAAALPLAVLLLLATLACGESENPEGFDGAIDCGASAWTRAYEYDPDHEGALTPFDAMVDWSDFYSDKEHRIHVESSRTGTVVVDAEEVAFMRVAELPTETFEVVEAEGCASFEPSS